jgi:hypothetical protein
MSVDAARKSPKRAHRLGNAWVSRLSSVRSSSQTGGPPRALRRVSRDARDGQAGRDGCPPDSRVPEARLTLGSSTGAWIDKLTGP